MTDSTPLKELYQQHHLLIQLSNHPLTSIDFRTWLLTERKSYRKEIAYRLDMSDNEQMKVNHSSDSSN